MNNFTDVWDVAKNKLFFVFFQTQELKETFLSEYTPQKGFGIFQTANGYKLYTNTMVFNANTKVSKEGEPFGLWVFSCFPMNQSQTLEAAVKRVQVVGLNRTYCCLLRENPYLDNAQNGTKDLLNYVNQESSKKYDIVETNNDSQIEFIQEHEEIIKEKQAFEETQLFSVEYSKFEDSLQNIQDGVVYKFAIDEETEEKLEGKFQENTGVEITSNDMGKNVLGTIVEAKDGWLFIKFHNIGNSYSRIAKEGTIKERSNPEYKYKLEALELLKKGLSPNKALLSIIVDGQVKPVSIKQHYVPYDVIEKDGSKHKNVNPSQKEAIEKALNVEDFLLVQGPPGTGKTTIITEMIDDFVRRGLRVLICSKNNLAVDNVLEKCQNLFYDNEKSKKMQCLRLGNEEKVLYSVRQSLPRPLTLKIQDNVKYQSNMARTAYLEREHNLLDRYEQAVRETSELCWLAKYFLEARENYLELLSAFQQNKFTFILGKTRKNSFMKELSFLVQQIDIITKQLVVLMRTEEINLQSNALQQYLKMTHDTYDAMEAIKKELNAASIRYGLLLREEKEKTISNIEEANIQKEKILKSICTLNGYKGNPAAEEARAELQQNIITAAYIDALQKKTEDQIKVLKSRRLMLKNVLDEWHEELESDQSSLEEPLLRTVKIIGATCIGVNTKNNFKNVEYDVAIVDEAGQIALHDLLVPLVKAKKTILIGDHLQLPPSAESDFCNYIQENNMLGFAELDAKEEIKHFANELNSVFSVSLFESLFRDNRFDNNKVMLDTQFRMHPTIADFISETFYEGKYKSGVLAKDRFLKIAGFSNPMYFIDTVNLKNKKEDYNQDETVHINSCEAEICADYLAKIIVAIENNDYEKNGKGLKDEEGNYDIGVITAYKRQIGVIREKLKKKLRNDFEPEKVEDIVLHLAINTLDSFQGRDNQIIFYSFVRSNKEYRIGFLNEVRRLNVMMTRAKSLLVMVGDSETLMNSRSFTVHEKKKAADYYSALVNYCKDNEGYIDYEYEGLK